MTTAFEGLGFGGPEFDLDNDLPGSLRAGLENLHIAAAQRGLPEETVAVVLEKAFDPRGEFVAGRVDGYNEVVALSLAVNGWEWTQACLVDPTGRLAEFLSVREQGIRYAASHFPELDSEVRGDVVNDLLLRELPGVWEFSTSVQALLPRWMIPGIVYFRLPLRLQDAKKRDEGSGRITVRRGGEEVTIFIESLNRPLDASGTGDEFGEFVGPLWEGSVDEAAVEAVVWAAARANLGMRSASLVERARVGAARAKVTLTVYAAMWVLTKGSQDSRDKNGLLALGSAEEVRQKYAEDCLLLSFEGLRAAAPKTWGAYPESAVPTREVIAQVATEATARGDVNAAWFARQEARRVEVAKSDRVLHGVRRLVESLIEEAARDTDN